MKKIVLMIIIVLTFGLFINVHADEVNFVGANITCPDGEKFADGHMYANCYIYVTSINQSSFNSIEMKITKSGSGSEKYNIEVNQIEGNGDYNETTGVLSTESDSNFSLDNNLLIKYPNTPEGLPSTMASLKVAKITVRANNDADIADGDTIYLDLTNITIGSKTVVLAEGERIYGEIKIIKTSASGYETNAGGQASAQANGAIASGNPKTGVVSVSAALIVGLIAVGSYIIFSKNKKVIE